MTKDLRKYQTLIDKLIDEVAEPDEIRELNRALCENPKLADALFSAMTLESLLENRASEPNERLHLEELLDRAVSQGDTPASRVTRAPMPQLLHSLGDWHAHPVRFVLLATLLTSVAWTLLFAFILPWGRREAPAPTDTVVAHVTTMKDVIWAQHSVRWQAGAALRKGSRVDLEAGLVHLLFRDGARVVVEGPATIRVNTTGAMTLEAGKLLAHVSKQAQGFTVETPNVDVVDLGTEFGVNVRLEETDVQVFKGKVQAYRHDSRDSGCLLVAGKAAVFGNSPQQGFYVKEKKMNRAIYLSLATVLAASAPAPAGAVLMSTNSVNDTSQVFFSASAIDLIDASQATFLSQDVVGFTATFASSTDNLNNGNVGTSGIHVGSTTFDGDGVWTSTFSLDTSTNTLGYNISRVHSYAGWSTASYGQSYELLVSTVGDASFTSLGTFNNGPGITGSDHSTKIEIFVDSGFIATGVDAVRFIFADSTAPGAADVIRELDVFGSATTAPVPEPATGALLGLGGMMVIGFARRRRHQRKNAA